MGPQLRPSQAAHLESIRRAWHQSCMIEQPFASSNPDSRSGQTNRRSMGAWNLIVCSPASPESDLASDKTPPRRGWRTRRPERPPFRVRFRPQVGLLEQRRLLSTLYATGSGVGDGLSQVYRIDDYASAPQAVDIGSSGATSRILH